MPMLPVSLTMWRRWNTSRTRPLFLRMWIRSSAVTMPAASWPRCCNTVSASYKAWLTEAVLTIPTIPHIDLLLRHEIAEPVEPGVDEFTQVPRQRGRPRDDPGVLPPGFAVHFQHLETDHENTDHEHAARRAEQHAEHAVGAVQPRLAHQHDDEMRQQRAGQQREHEHDEPAQPELQRRGTDRVQERLHQRRESPCEPGGHRPVHQRHRLAEKTTEKADHHRNGQRAQQDVIDYHHGSAARTQSSTRTARAPLCPAARTCSSNRSAAGRSGTGPTRTRYRVPASVTTRETKAAKPAAVSRLCSAWALSRCEKLPTCTLHASLGGGCAAVPPAGCGAGSGAGCAGRPFSPSTGAPVSGSGSGEETAGCGAGLGGGCWGRSASAGAESASPRSSGAGSAVAGRCTVPAPLVWRASLSISTAGPAPGSRGMV